MDKLYRYKGKDYSMCIDFPVEIIGKDGIVRHYSFEESIHLYQRRIRSARMRYEQQDIIVAEINHCSKRIAQLRRSYYARYGWEAFLFLGDIPYALTTELSGELAAYLRRRFGCGIHRDKARITCVQETETHFILIVECNGAENILLHLFTDKSSYKEYLSIVRASNTDSNESEYLLDHIDDDDYWVVVTATQSNQSLPNSWSEQELESIYIRDAIQSIHEGNLLESMAHFMLAIEENPYRRGAYWGISILAEQMRIHGEAELVLKMAVNYFPNDAGLWLRLAASLLRRGDIEAKDALIKAQNLNSNLNTNFLWMIHHFIHSNNRQARIYLNRVKRDSNPMYQMSLKWLNVQIEQRKNFIQLSHLITLMSVLCCITLHPIFLILNVLSLALFVYAEMVWKRRFKRALHGKSYHQIILLPSSDIYQVTRAFHKSH